MTVTKDWEDLTYSMFKESNPCKVLRPCHRFHFLIWEDMAKDLMHQSQTVIHFFSLHSAISHPAFEPCLPGGHFSASIPVVFSLELSCGQSLCECFSHRLYFLMEYKNWKMQYHLSWVNLSKNILMMIFKIPTHSVFSSYIIPWFSLNSGKHLFLFLFFPSIQWWSKCRIFAL